jgi:hypothetical protein
MLHTISICNILASSSNFSLGMYARQMCGRRLQFVEKIDLPLPF